MADSPKYMEIVRWSRAQIDGRALHPGDRFLSEKELSGRFGLSRQTVRHALQLLENEGYIRRVRGSGTYVADRTRPASGEKTMTVGVISTYMSDYIFPGILRGIESVLTRSGYMIQFAFTHNRVANESLALRSMLEKRVDGMIVEPTKSGLPNLNLDLYRQIQERRIPLVFFNAHYPSLSVPYVSLDDEEAGLAATRCLIRSGHTRIAGMFLQGDLQGRLRYLGYIRALAEANLALCDEHVLWYATEDRPTFLDDPARILARLEGCTAVFCYNDQLAVRLIEMLRSQGLRVPEDFSVIGVDNCDMAALCAPPLTTVNLPVQELGQAAAATLLSIIAGNAVTPVLFPPAVVERASVAPPGGG